MSDIITARLNICGYKKRLFFVIYFMGFSRDFDIFARTME